MFNRQELEDIWANKPHGYFTQFMKRNRGAKKYRVMTRAFKRTETEVDSASTVCYAKNVQSATNGWSADLERQIRSKHGLDRWDSSVVYRTFAEEIKQ